MRRLVTGDVHISQNPRDAYRLVFLEKTLPDLIDRHKVEQLLVLGDLTQAKEKHPASLVNSVVGAFHQLSKQCEIVLLQGNHDYQSVGSPFFEFLSCFENISWIGAPIERENCLFLPHTRDYKTEWQHQHFDGFDYIFAHNTFSGASSNGHSLSGIPPTIFPEDSFVISGDIHEPQTVNGNVHYVGAPFITEFGPSYQPRVLLLDGLNVKSLKLQGQQKRLVYCAVNKVGGERELAFDHDANSNDLVKIQVEMAAEDAVEWASIKEGIERWAHENKFIVAGGVIPKITYSQGERRKVVQGNRRTDSQYLNQFVQRTGADDKTAAVGKEIVDLV